MSDKHQMSFLAGEISPQAFGRTDLQKYQQGVETLRNFYVQPVGGITNRAGSPFINYTKDQSNAVRSIPFEYNAGDQYVLEFGNAYMRIKKNGGYVLEPFSITVIEGISQASPAVVTATAHPLTDGDYVTIFGVEGMTEVNDRTFLVGNSAANTFELIRTDSEKLHDFKTITGITQANPGVVTYDSITPVVNGDYVKITGVNGMVEVNDSTFTVAGATATTFQLNDLSGAAVNSGAFTAYVNGGRTEGANEDSTLHTPYVDAGVAWRFVTITDITNADPAVVTATAHGFLDGDWVVIERVGGMTEVNGKTFIVANKNANDFELTDIDGNNVDSAAFGAYTDGGTAKEITTIDTPYTLADLPNLKYDQSADILTVCAGGRWWPREFTRGLAGDHDFSESLVSFAPKQPAPTIVSVTQEYQWSISGITIADPLQLNFIGGTTDSIAVFDNVTIGARIIISGVADGTAGGAGTLAGELNGNTFQVLKKDTSSKFFHLADKNGNPINATALGWTGGYVTDSGRMSQNSPLQYRMTAVNTDGEESLSSPFGEEEFFLDDVPDSQHFARIPFTRATGEIDHYNFYRKDKFIFGFVGSMEGDEPGPFFAQNVIPDATDVAPPEEATNPFCVLEAAQDMSGLTAADPGRVTMGVVHGFVEDDVVFIDGAYKTVTITAITQANPAVVTATAHDYTDGVEVWISGVGGMTEVNDEFFKINVTGANTFQLVDIDSSGFTLYTTGGSANTLMDDLNRTLYQVNFVSVTQFDLRDFNGNDVDTANFGTFSTTPDAGTVARCNPDEYPSTVSFHEQRRMFGRSPNHRQRVWGTQIGHIYNMNETTPSKANDAISFDLASTRANEVRHLVSMQQLLIFTSGAEWESTSGDNGYTIENIRNRRNTFNGTVDNPKPLQIGNTALYIQELGNSIWDLQFSLERDSYGGTDRTILSEHLFEGKTIVDWAYQRIPTRIVWCVMSDGTINAMTYLPEFNTWAWSRHDTDGEYESIAAINEGNEAAVYVTVRRVIGGVVRRFSERFHSRTIQDVRDAHIVDSGFELNSPLDITGVSLGVPCQVTSTEHGFLEDDSVDLTGIVGAVDPETDEDLKVTLNDTQFKIANVKKDTFELFSIFFDVDRTITDITSTNPPVMTYTGDPIDEDQHILITGVGGMVEVNNRYFKAKAATTTTIELADLEDVFIDASNFTTYTAGGKAQNATPIDSTLFSAYEEKGVVRKAVTVLTGLDHLEGKTVSILANGNSQPAQVVVGGSITLSAPASRIHVGLGYTSQLKSLSITDPEGQLAGRLKSPFRYVFRLAKTRELRAGPNFDTLALLKEREFENYNQATGFQEGEFILTVTAEWDINAGMSVQQIEPLPVEIQSIGFDFGDGISDS